MGLTRIAITRPVFILMLMILSVLMGTIGYNSMRVELNPEVNFGIVTVTTVYPGASPDVATTLISRPIEEAVAGVAGIREVTSTSQEGFSLVQIQFEIGTDMDKALNEVRAKVDGIVGDLPRQAERPIINQFDTASEPVLNLVLKSDRLDNRALRDLADDRLKDRFSRIPGVGAVNVSGGEEREIQIQVKRDALLAYGIGVTDVLRAVQASTLDVPSGRIRTERQEISVRVPAEFQNMEQIENSTISLQDPNSQGRGQPTIVRLKDVATVTDASAERQRWSRLAGSDAVLMTIQKSREGNAVQISAGAKQVISDIEREFGVTTVKTFDQSVQITESIFDLNFALGFGIFLVALIVYIFLHNFRGMLIVAIAIPICLFGTLFVLWMFGFTINNLSMLALSLAVGVLVDDAIVVLENIYRHLQMGEEPAQAALNGRSEIGLAAIAITLADVVVFVPIAFMGGVLGQFFKPLGIGFAVAVLLSLFVSFTVTPMLASRWYRKGENVEHPTGRFASWFERNFKRLERAYGRSLEWALNHRWFVFITGNIALVAVFLLIGGANQPSLAQAVQVGMMPLALAGVVGFIVFVVNFFRGYRKPQFILYGLLFGAIFPVSAVAGFAYASWKGEDIFKFQFFPPSDAGSVIVNVTMPPGTSLEQTENVVAGIEKTVGEHPDAKYVVSTIGSRGGGDFSAGNTGTNYAQVRITLHEKRALLDTVMFWVAHEEELRTRTDTAVAADMLEAIGRVPGAQITVAAGEGFGFGAAIQVSFASDNREALVQTVQRVQEGLSGGAIAGVINVDVSSKPGKPEIRINPDRVRLADLGLSPADVANTMRVLYEGNNDTKFRVSGREYDIRVMMDLEDRNNPNLLENIPVTFVSGNPVYLTEVATIDRGVALDKIDRRNRIEEIRISADLLPGYAAGGVQEEINQWMARENLVAEGVIVQPLGQADVQNREVGFLFGALIIGLVLVYMLLASLYDNLLYPFIVQLSQPQALVGAILALIITDKSLNIVGFIGVIALVGLVGKNAILLVDYTNTLRERGRNRHDALVEAGPVRLRPITMTTLALILGLLPVALAIGRGSEFRETIGITIIGGITLSTLLTLLVIPCSYTIFDDLSLWLGRVFGRGRQPAVASGPALVEPGSSPAPEPPTEAPQEQPKG